MLYEVITEYKYAFTDALSVTGNLRYDSINLDYEDSTDNNFDKSFTVYSYRLGSTYLLGSSDAISYNFV